MKPFSDTRRILWLGGVVLVLLGILAAFVVLPAASPLKSTAQPEVNVPRMENVPAEGASKMKLDVERQ